VESDSEWFSPFGAVTGEAGSADDDGEAFFPLRADVFGDYAAGHGVLAGA
jgi:hypothetical protein